MKRLINTTLTVIMAALLNDAQATIRTVDNTINAGAQYTTLQAAYNSASDGDTLMVTGSAIQYQLSSGAWDKDLVVIGSGFNSPKQLFNDVKFGSGYFDLADSSIFLGIRFTNNVRFTDPVSGLYFESCRFDGEIGSNGNNVSNITILNCVFTNSASNLNIYNSDCASVLLSHCVLSGTINGSNNLYNYGVVVDHCVFLNNTSCFVNVYNIIVSNCIFNGTNIPIAGVYNSSFNHNLVHDNISNYWATNGNTSTNNIENQDPLFVNVASSTWATSMNFHLQNGSPAIGSGTSGSDMGLHEIGSSFSNYGEPFNIPVIRRMDIQNQNVPQNGNVNVKVRSTKSRTN
jgi:hypothetical protein